MSAECRRSALRLYAPTLVLLSIYFGLRWIAFGNLKGGDALETQYLSVSAFLGFHPRFFASLVQEDLFAFARIPGVGWLLVGVVATALAIVAVRGAEARRWRDLLCFGPVWYLGSMSIYYGTYFSNRHHPLILVGLVLFGTLLLAELTRNLSRAGGRAVSAAVFLACALVFLPPTLSTQRRFGEASETVRTIRAWIERETEHLPDGSAVLVTNVPQETGPPWYFGWGFLSSLKRPFTPSDVGNRLLVVNPRNRMLTRSTTPVPEQFDLRLEVR